MRCLSLMVLFLIVIGCDGPVITPEVIRGEFNIQLKLPAVGIKIEPNGRYVYASTGEITDMRFFIQDTVISNEYNHLSVNVSDDYMQKISTSANGSRNLFRMYWPYSKILRLDDTESYIVIEAVLAQGGDFDSMGEVSHMKLFLNSRLSSEWVNISEEWSLMGDYQVVVLPTEGGEIVFEKDDGTRIEINVITE